MLILTRRRDEKIVFPFHGITVQVVKVNGSYVTLGIEAPPDVKIMRGEVLERDEDTSGPVGNDAR